MPDAPHATTAQVDAGDRTTVTSVAPLIIALAAAVGLAGIATAQPLASANDRSRWATVFALVHHGTFQIDEVIRRPGWDTVDKVRHEGHFYSSKPPLLPTLAAGVYWCVWKATGYDLENHTGAATRLVLIVVNLLPMIAALVVLSNMLNRYARTEFTRNFVLLTAAVGTFLTTFLTTFNNHTVAAVSVIFALSATLKITADGSRCPLQFALAGFFAAFACANELPAALFGVALFGLLAWQAPRQTWCWFVPAALVPLAAFFYTTYLQTGGWKPFYTYYGTEKYLYIHEGVPSYWMEPKGLDRNLDTPAEYFLHCTIGHHGIFSLSPVFLLTIVGWATIRKWKPSPLVSIMWLGLLLTVAVLGFYLSRTQNYNYGGNTSGLRWAFWLIPFWLLALVPVLDAWGNRRSVRAVAGLFLAVSIFSALYPLRNPWQQPWLFTLMQDKWGWIDYRDPPPQLDRPVHSWIGSLPHASGAWIEFAGYDPDGDIVRLRLNSLEIEKADGRRLYKIEVRKNPGRTDEVVKTFHVDEVQFETGRPPAEFLVWPDRESSASQRAATEDFIRGLPVKTDGYRARREQYLRTPLQPDALRCTQATAYPSREEQRTAGRYMPRCDVWLCDDVPFGVVQFERTIVDRSTGTEMARRRMIAIAASPLDDE